MSRIKNTNTRKIRPLIITGDVFIICFALAFSWIFRAQFKYFIFDLRRFFYILPVVVGLRLITNAFFEHYSLSFVNLHTKDITSIFKHCLIPSLIFLGLRFFVPITALKLPLSMIFMEYVITVVGMLFLRLFILNYQHINFVKKNEIVFKSKVLIIGSKKNIIESINIQAIKNDFELEIIGILSSNPLEWNTDFNNIRILGGYTNLKELVAKYEGMLFLLICQNVDVDEKMNIIFESRSMNVHSYSIKGNKIFHHSILDFIDRIPQGTELIPYEIKRFLKEKTIVVLGENSFLLEYIRSIQEQITNLYTFSVSVNENLSEIVEKTKPDYIFDFRFLNDNFPLSVQDDFEKLLKYLEEKKKYLSENKYTSKYIIAYSVPKVLKREDVIKRLADAQSFNILLVEGKISNNITNQIITAGNCINQYDFWDNPKWIVSFMFKAFYCSTINHNSEIFYAKSNDAFLAEDLQTIIDLIINPFKKIDLVWNKNKNSIDTIAENKTFHSDDFLPTKFSNLFLLEKKCAYIGTEK